MKAPVLSILLAVGSGSARAASPSADLNLVIQETCVTCHNETTLLGNLSLEAFDVAKAEKNAVVAEKVIRKLRAGMMPPPRATPSNLPDVSNPLPEGRQPGLMVVNLARVFPGREQDYVNVMKSDFLPHFDAANVNHVTGILALGGEGGFLHVFYFENFAELDKGSPVMRALGPEGASAVTAQLSGIVSSSALWVARVIPELSFGAKEQGPASESDKK